MEGVHEASWYEPVAGPAQGEGAGRAAKRVHCTLCPHDCKIADGHKGACGVRVNRHGKLYTLVYDRIIGAHLEAIEKKPLFHFLPGSKAWSFGTVGCNLHCLFCQNWDISQWPTDHVPRKIEWDDAADPEAVDAGGGEGGGPDLGCPELARLGDTVPGAPATPAGIVEAAVASGAKSIAYTYTEPTIFFELARDTARLAREAGLRNVFVSNGFISEGPQREIAEVLDGVNVDLKFARAESYLHVSRARREPILDAIRRYHDLGVWLELTTLVVPGLNDSDEELKALAEFVRSVGPDVPWHVSQFYPAYKMMDRPPTSTDTLHRAEEIGEAAGLSFVYVGNVPGEHGESTCCPDCGELLIDRYGLTMRSNRVRDGACPDCGRAIPGVEMDGR